MVLIRLNSTRWIAFLRLLARLPQRKERLTKLLTTPSILGKKQAQ
jgi:hypothetical protein